MSLKQQIEADAKAALLASDRSRVDTLRGLKAAILDVEVTTGAREQGLADDKIEQVVAREIKKRTESAKIYRANDRIDLAEAEEREIEILQAYLPEQLAADELQAIVDQQIAQIGATSPAQMGQVIGAVKAVAGNRADGALIASVVKNTMNK